MKWAHVDEAGTSAREEWCIVAGIVSSPDGQWRQLNRYLEEIRIEFAPENHDLIFHAKDIWHGAKAFDRDKWSRSKRLALIRELASIPRKFNLPVIGAAIEKSAHDWTVDGDKTDEQAWHYALAFGMCVVHFESFLRELPDAREVGTVIAEDASSMRRHAQFGYSRLADREGWSGPNASYLPISRVVEQPLFTSKKGSALLQIADTVAFLLCRSRNGRVDADEYLDLFREQVYILPHQRR